MAERIWAQRREFLIFLPVALLLLVALSTFVLFAYRNTVRILLEDRQAEAGRLARLLAGELELGARLGDHELRERLPSARSVAVLDASGRLVAATEPRAIEGMWRRNVLGVSGVGRDDAVTGTAGYRRAGKSFTVQVDLRAAVLRSRERALRVLTPVVLVANGVITVLVLVLLRHFWAPFESLLVRARESGKELPAETDEVDFLVTAFEKALESLAGPGGGSDPRDALQRQGALPADELKAIEGALTRSLQSGVLLVDSRGGVLALNDLGAELLDMEAADVESRIAGAPIGKALSAHPELAVLLDRAVRQQREVRREECVIDAASGSRTLGLTVHPLRREDAVVRGFLILFADLTETRRELAEQRLAESLSQLGELAAGVAHELRNSLGTLRGYLTLIERAPPGEPIVEDLAEMRRESDHLERVLEDFLTFARPGSVRPRDVDLLSLVRQAAADPALGGAEIEIETTDPEAGSDPSGEEGWRVQGDPQLLERALRNLLANAVEAQAGASRDGEAELMGPVRIRVRARDQGVEVRIDDRGPGLSPEAQQKLFDPFFSQRPGGIGMGLALTRRIAILHGGKVALQNRQGGGARATLWVPAGRVDTIGNSREVDVALPG